MKITLYENCIVNDRYNEVFHISIFDDYLNLLSHVTLEIDDTYTTFNGRLVIQNVLTNNKSIYNYNYMKVETDINQFEGVVFTRYCFVDNIEIHNGYVTLDYSEDIWHSYSKGINIRNSYLTRSRQLQYGNKTIPVYRLPLQYGGNNLPETVRRLPVDTGEYLIVARLQTYTLSASGGTSTNKNATYVLISNKTNQDEEEGKVLPFTDINELEETLSIFERQSAGEHFHDHNIILPSGGNSYFEIDNIHIVPRYFFPATMGETIYPNIGAITTSWASGLERPTWYYNCFKITLFLPENITTGLVGYHLPVYEGVIPHDFKNVSFGPLNKQIGLDNNGSDISFSILVGGTIHEFSILLAIQNKLVDITNTFEIVLPFNSVSGDVTAQRKIAFNTGLISQAMKIIPAIGTIAGGYSSGYKAMSETGGGLVPYSGVGGSYDSASYMDTLATETYNYPSKRQIQEGGKGIIGGIIEMSRLLAPKYRSETAVVSHTQGILNCVNFPVLTKMVSDNDIEVQEAINNVGYSVDEIFGTEAINTIFDDYNVVQFDFINLYGDFPQNIANALKSILRNGVKIWYTSNV